ncbi:ribonuclease [Kitasatospora phosalacinea]|uniref:Ribonuclease n=1 Tax=Kitasatospora phosalacinea TaxID=2065 RepID=A0ABW6GMS1_9ACTN
MNSRNRLVGLVAAILLGLAAGVAALLNGGNDPDGASAAKSPAGTPTARAAWTPSDPALADVCRSALPAQALDTLGLIARGGPYPYRSDGVVFENREGRLPRQGSGYYHEFTVVTPGSGDRGARRIVTGGTGEQYWTADHYATFQEVDPRC